MKPSDDRTNLYIYFDVKIMIKILKVKLISMYEYQNLRLFSKKDYTPN